MPATYYKPVVGCSLDGNDNVYAGLLEAEDTGVLTVSGVAVVQVRITKTVYLATPDEWTTDEVDARQRLADRVAQIAAAIERQAAALTSAANMTRAAKAATTKDAA